jgi:hypothetical protein
VRVIPTPAEDAGSQAFERAVEEDIARNKVNAMSKACEQVRCHSSIGHVAFLLAPTVKDSNYPSIQPAVSLFPPIGPLGNGNGKHAPSDSS